MGVVMEYLESLLSIIGSPWQWLLGASCMLAALTALIFMRRLCRRRCERKDLSGVLKIGLSVLSKTNILFIVLLSSVFALQWVALPPKVEALTEKLFFLVVWLQCLIWVNAFIHGFFQYYVDNKKVSGDVGGITGAALIAFIARVFSSGVILLLLLDNLGIDITALVASLGIGGVAVALAVQNILGDIFASLSIALDKPFIVGDFIVVGDEMGVVEYVGLKTTRVRSLGGEQIIFANAELLKSRIRNYKRMFERRVVFGFGVTYQTKPSLLSDISSQIKQIIEAIDSTRFDRAHFKSFGNSSLDFEVVYYVLSSEFNIYMDIQQKINLELMNYFEKSSIEFAYPTQTLYLQGVLSANMRGHEVAEDPQPV